MSEQEKKLLAKHNQFHTKAANKATISDCKRFYFDYSDGKRKHDYQCGDTVSAWLRQSINHSTTSDGLRISADPSEV